MTVVNLQEWITWCWRLDVRICFGDWDGVVKNGILHFTKF